MNTLRHSILAAMCVVGCGLINARPAMAGAEVQGWGSLRGIRVEGQLMAFGSSIRAVSADGTQTALSGRELVTNPTFRRDGANQITAGGLNFGPTGSTTRPTVAGGGRGRGGRGGAAGLNFTQTITDDGAGTTAVSPSETISEPVNELPLVGRIGHLGEAITVNIQITTGTAQNLSGLYYDLLLPRADFAGASIVIAPPSNNASGKAALATTRPIGENVYLGGSAKSVTVIGSHRQIDVAFADERNIQISDDPIRHTDDIDLRITLATGNLAANQSVQAKFTITATGDVDATAAHLAVDSANPGRAFEGLGGNFRLQSPQDPPQVQYDLDHLRVVWGRVAMPLDQWQPNQTADPSNTPTASLNSNIRQQMEMAQTLAKRNIPMIISVWQAPQWALLQGPEGTRGVGGPGVGRKLDPAKLDDVCKAIGSYLKYLKANYGAEPKLFSFNESDMGINVLQNAQEHCDAIKRLGAYFASQGLVTKMLLGDCSDPTPIHFIDVALADPEAVKYIGAVSFHSWRGGTNEQFARWGAAAKQLNVPVFVGEGGTDPDGYRYSAIFAEPWYAQDEIGLYINICRVAQVASVLQWQLTENYSILTGNATAGFQPAMRFYQLKQLDMTPAGSLALPITNDKTNLLPCAYLDKATGTFTLHMVNDGPTRPLVLTGVPANIKELHVYVTDKTRGMKELDKIPVNNGVAGLTVNTQTMTTLMGTP